MKSHASRLLVLLLCGLAANVPSSASMSVGQNLDSVTYYSACPVFANSMKQAKPWMTRSVGGTEWSSNYGPEEANPNAVPNRDDGWPAYVPFSAGGKQHYVHTMLPCYENGEHRILASGKGKIRISLPNVSWREFTLNGSLDVKISASGVNNPADFNPGRATRREVSYIYIEIRESQSADPVRDIRVMRPGYHNAGRDAFDNDFKNRLGYYATIRFMDWMRTNGSTRSVFNWKYNRPDFYTAATKFGVPMQHIVDLGNELNRAIWVNVPERMTEQGMTDMANYIAGRIKSGLLVFVEYTNEYWNDASAFTAGKYIDQQSWSGANRHQKYGTRCKIVFDRFRAAFNSAGKGAQLRCVLGAWASNGNAWTTRESLKTCPASNFHGIAIAPYFGTHFTSAPSPLPSDDELAGDEYVKMARIREWVDTFRTLCTEQGKMLYCYEGGQHYDVTPGLHSNTALIDRLFNFNRSWQMRNVYRHTYLSALNERKVVNFCHFSLCQRWNNYGTWGSMEWINQTIGTASGNAQKEWAIRDWKNNN